MLLGLEHMFTVVHDLTDQGLGISDLHEIQTGSRGSALRLLERYNAHLFPVGSNQPYIGRRNFVIYRRALTLRTIFLDRLFLQSNTTATCYVLTEMLTKSYEIH